MRLTREKDRSASRCKQMKRTSCMGIQKVVKGAVLLNASFYPRRVVTESPSEHIPQHRVRTSRRALHYGSDHPWNNFTSLDLGGKTTAYDHYENGETVPASGLTNLGLTDGGKVAQTGSDVQPNDSREEEQVEDTDENVTNQAISSKTKDAGDDVVSIRIRDHKVMGNFNNSRRSEEIMDGTRMTNYTEFFDVTSNLSSFPSVLPSFVSSFKSSSLTPTPAFNDDTVKNNHTDKIKSNIKNNATRPIRIRPYLSDDPSSGITFLDKFQRRYLLDEVLQPAMNAWSDALSIIRIKGNLTIDRSQLYDGQSCGPGIDSGLPSVVVPADHFTTGIEDADIVIYLSVSFLPNERDEYESTSAKDYSNVQDVVDDPSTISPTSSPSSSPTTSPTTSSPTIRRALRNSVAPSKSNSIAPSGSAVPSIPPSSSISPSSSVEPSASFVPSASPSTTVSPSSTTNPSISFSPSHTSAPSTSNRPSISFSPSTEPSISTSPSTSISPSTSNVPSVSSLPSIASSAFPTTSAPSIIPSVTLAPSTFPSASNEPSQKPTTSSLPSISFSPSTSLFPSPAPSISFSPSSGPTSRPSSEPSRSSSPTMSISPSTSIVPSISTLPSIGPSIFPSTSSAPTTSLSPSISPTTSFSPSKSFSPTSSANPSSSATPSLSSWPTASSEPTLSSEPTTSFSPSITSIPSLSSRPTISSGPTVSSEPTTSSPPSTTSAPSNIPSNVPSTSPSSAPTHATPLCSGSYLAQATYCSTDQFDRPVAGLLHFCINPDDFFSDQKLELNRVTAMHELGHILGFNIQSLAHFRDRETGKPLTKRDKYGDVQDVEMECTGVKKDRGWATIPLPSKEVLQFRKKRDVRVAQVVTSTVKQVTRNQFNCQALEGAELESEFYHPTVERNITKEEKTGKMLSQGICISDHWERRLFKMDIMNPIMDNLNFKPSISPLTLAYFIDSGWYDVDVSKMSYPDSWGRGAGCDFVEKTCITSNGEVSLANSQFFCGLSLDSNGAIENEFGCTDDLSAKAVCSTVEYDVDLPFEYRYFADHKEVGGYDPYLDYCPIYEGFNDGLCIDRKSVRYPDLESSGSNSRCISSQIKGEKQPLCLPIACIMNEQKLHVKVDGVWRTCDSDGRHLSTYIEGDYVICPDARRICPAFYCPGNCLGAQGVGKCDHVTGSCEKPVLDITLLEDAFAEIYFLSADELIDDKKDIFEQTARMFNTMSLGDVIGFVTCSLVTVLLLIIVLLFLIRTCRGGRNWNLRLQKLSDCFQLILRKSDWTVNAMQTNSGRHPDNERNRNKDKMIASVLVDMRVRSNDSKEEVQEERKTDVQANCSKNGSSDKHKKSNITSTHGLNRTFIRSELPPLPNLGRVVLIPGCNFVDDSPLRPEDNGNLATLAGTVATLSIERSTTMEVCSMANSTTSKVDLLEVNEFEDDPFAQRTDRPRRRLTRYLFGKR